VFAGSINGSARHGTLGALINAGADPDTGTTMRCVLSNSTLELGTGTTEDADNNRLLLMVDGEVMSYRDAVLISAGTYDVSYLRRGKFGSSRTGHASGAKWARLDASIFRMRYDSGLAGRTVYFKFPSKNVYGGGQQTLDDCTAYTLTISRDVSSGLFFKSTDTLAWDTDAYSADGYTDGCSLQFRALRADGRAAIGLNSDPSTNASFDTLDYCFVLREDGTFDLYESGSPVVASAGTYTTLTQFDLRHDGYMVQYIVNGAVVRAVPIVGQRFFMDSSIYTPAAGFVGIQWGPLSANGVRDSNLLNVAAWVVGTSSFAWFANFVLAGNSGAPLDPYGVSSPLWECRPDASGEASGGFINFGDLQGLDHSKAYRFCMWFRWNSAAHADAGSIYLGPGTAETNDLTSAGGGANANPYFIGNVPAAMGLTPNKWYLIVGVVHGSGYAGGNSGLSGVYDPATGQRVVLGPDYRNIANVVRQVFRAYPYYYTDTSARIWMARPRVDLMDGREPSLSALLSPNGQLAYRNTVGTPQIDRGAATEILVATKDAQSLSFSTSIPVQITVPAQPEETPIILTATCTSQLTALSAGTSSISARIIAGQAGGAGEWNFGFPTFSDDNVVHRRDFTAAGESWSAVSLERRFTLPANTSIEVALASFVSGSGSLRNIILKVEVIKR
jgi:hypothetical protein